MSCVEFSKDQVRAEYSTKQWTVGGVAVGSRMWNIEFQKSRNPVAIGSGVIKPPVLRNPRNCRF